MKCLFSSSAAAAGVFEAGPLRPAAQGVCCCCLRLVVCRGVCGRVRLWCTDPAAEPHWFFLPSWPRPLTQNTFAISFIPSPDGARRSFMRGLPKARTVTGRTSLPPTRRFILPRFFPPPAFLPFYPSSLPSGLHQLMNKMVFLPCKSLSKASYNPKPCHSSFSPPRISKENCLFRHCYTGQSASKA